MRVLIFGLTMSSSWGNGHATLWRGLVKGLAARGHRVTFFERDTPYYAYHRDLAQWPYGELLLYPSWEAVLPTVEAKLADADAVIVTSFCPDANAALEMAQRAAGVRKVFYDMDTPVTLDRRSQGESVPYLPPDGLGGYDVVLSFTGGPVLERLRRELGARDVRVLYGHADPEAHRPETPEARFQADLSYLGTFAADRQPAVENLFVQPARDLPDRRFLLAGSSYPSAFPWQPNIFYLPHLPPSEHPAFFSSSGLTLNVTRRAMAENGYCPSGRLFEAAACGTPIISDPWPGLADLFEPGKEILIADGAAEVVAALNLPPGDLAMVGKAARARVLEGHTSALRAAELETALLP